jgi:hypothetical protein
VFCCLTIWLNSRLLTEITNKMRPYNRIYYSNVS